MATQQFTHVFTESGFTDVVVATFTTPATNSTGYGPGYAVTSITGSVRGASIAGEVGTGGKVQSSSNTGAVFDNTIFTSNSYGSDTNVYGIDADGMKFIACGREYNLYNFGWHNLASYDPRHSPSITHVVITYSNAPCYCPGTLILTNHGEVPVEILAIGDTVVTASGEHRPIRWIGRRSYDGRFIAGNHLMLPVTIQAGALAEGVPHTDLTVSPGHAMWVDGQLVPAWRLINGVSVTQAGSVEHVAYFHVELHRHDVLLANGAPAESFLDETGFRGQFHSAAEFAALYPDAPPLMPMQARLEDGFALQRIQERVAARAGILPVIEPAGRLRGFLDQAGPERVCGWAQDVEDPEEPVTLEISVDGVPVLCVLANGWRADLREAGLGSGCHAFDATLPAGLAGTVTVRRVTDGAMLTQTEAAQRRAA